ncbi:hypothetical protein CPB84DRAFT_1748941 [Gymnopilus junonius]|uniref:Uncharacterized protein n=1 Tax=Gymnopilus junonius TaxID=109634 RepID=A0A9P5TKB4_GYMJU|nr:hypothetical protein CPB84DRAFT_1748941 [Gymnopilus junonius]
MSAVASTVDVCAKKTSEGDDPQTYFDNRVKVTSKNTHIYRSFFSNKTPGNRHAATGTIWFTSPYYRDDAITARALSSSRADFQHVLDGAELFYRENEGWKSVPQDLVGQSFTNILHPGDSRYTGCKAPDLEDLRSLSSVESKRKKRSISKPPLKLDNQVGKFGASPSAEEDAGKVPLAQNQWIASLLEEFQSMPISCQA